VPDFEAAYPYGLEHSVASREMLASALQLPVTILLEESAEFRKTTQIAESGVVLMPRLNTIVAV